MKKSLVHGVMVVLLLLLASGVSTHDLHIQEMKQGFGGIMD